MNTSNRQELRIGRWSLRVAVAVTAAAALLGTAGPASARTVVTPGAVALKAQAARAAFSNARFGIPKVTSPNWSGYVDTNYTTHGNFTKVSAHWNVPEVAAAPSDCTAGTFATGEGLSGFWIGLDGYGDGTVEQTGTATECYKGSAYYWSWYEMYPKAPVVIGSVNPGDHMAATVSFKSGKYTLTLADLTSGAKNSTVQSCPSGHTCNNHSAEVIAEAPGGCTTAPGQTCRGKLYPMPDYRWVGYQSISVGTPSLTTGIGNSGFGPLNITMKNSFKIDLADVSSTINKAAFTDSWRASG